jgi:hypothetical protein
MSECFAVSKVIDGNNFNIAFRLSNAAKSSAYPAETVYCNSYL